MTGRSITATSMQTDYSRSEQSTEKIGLSIVEALAFYYILTPVVVFFAGFVRLEIAVPAVLFLIWILARVTWRTRFRRPPIAATATAALIAVALAILSGALGWLTPTSDWNKHYAVLNFLSSRSWPPVAMTVEGSVQSLRYALGWYLMPALAVKKFGLHGANAVAAAWSMIGLLIASGLLYRSVSNGRLRILAPVVFFLFSGADLIGTWWTGFQTSPYHIEWWSGWVEFSSNVTSMLWTPQHAIPAWIAVALMLAQAQRPSAPDLLGVLFFGVILWSPFTAIGLLPLGLAFCWQTRSLHVMLNWTTVAAACLIGLPLVLYLTADSATILHGFIWNSACVINRTFPDAPCFDVVSYLRFLLIEVAPIFIATLLLVPTWRRFTVVAGAVLALLPLYRFGETHDLAMRGSVPALSILAAAAARIIAEARAAAAISVLVLLGLGVPTAVIEIEGALLRPRRPVEMATFANISNFERYRSQYFALEPARVLRSNLEVDPARNEVLCRAVFDLTQNAPMNANLIVGMGDAEPQGRWTTGETASFSCQVPTGTKVRSITLDASAFASQDRPLHVAFSFASSNPIGRTFRDADLTAIELLVPPNPTNVFKLQIDIPGATSPKTLGLGADARKLGLLIRTLRLDLH